MTAPPTVEEITARAASTGSDDIVIVRGGCSLLNRSFSNCRRAVYIASVGKPLVSCAIGRAVALGALQSVDEPVASFFPEWRQGRKRLITIRHILTHRSGIQNVADASIELEPAPDIVRLALAAELTEIPGEKMRYNNKAVAILGGIIERATGCRFDVFVEQELFTPMEIKEFDWVRDATGTPTTYGAFVLRADDLVKFGQLILDNGRFGGTQLLNPKWVAESLAPSSRDHPELGWLWYRLTEVGSQQTGQSAQFVAYYHVGFRGNYLVAIPDQEIVAARLISREGFARGGDVYSSFIEDICRLANPQLGELQIPVA